MHELSVGTTVQIWVGVIRHFGIISDRFDGGEPMVISSSLRSGEVAEESMRTFAQGRKVHPVGYLGDLPPHQVIARARSALGSKWKLFTANCEHFVYWVHGQPLRSPQLAMAMSLVVLTGLTLIAKRR